MKQSLIERDMELHHHVTKHGHSRAVRCSHSDNGTEMSSWGWRPREGTTARRLLFHPLECICHCAVKEKGRQTPSGVLSSSTCFHMIAMASFKCIYDWTLPSFTQLWYWGASVYFATNRKCVFKKSIFSIWCPCSE